MFSKIVGFKFFISSAMIFSSADFVPSYAHDLRGNVSQEIMVNGISLEETYKRKLHRFNEISNAYNNIGRFISAEDQGCLSQKKNPKIFDQFFSAFEKAKSAMPGTQLDYNKNGQPSARWVREQMYPTMAQAHREMLDAFAALTKDQKAANQDQQEADPQCAPDADSETPVVVPSCKPAEELGEEDNSNILTRIWLYIYNGQKTVADPTNDSRRAAPAETKPNSNVVSTETKPNSNVVSVETKPNYDMRNISRPTGVPRLKHSDKGLKNKAIELPPPEKKVEQKKKRRGSFYY